MLQNIRVDMLYYRTSTDFEMEFNLGGCCRMRMFTDKTDTRKGLVGLLARAVSRSRVIIACGPLFGEKGLIATVAAAVGRPLVATDNAAYGIETDEKIEIIEGSMPLVTPEGFFGGCIIESGPQTIILLTENKSIRKTIMKKLIHPYITEISYSAVHEGDAVPPKPSFEAPSVEVEQQTTEEQTPEAEEQETVEDEKFEIDTDLEQELADETEAEINGDDFDDISVAEDEQEVIEMTSEREVPEAEQDYTPENYDDEKTEPKGSGSVNAWIIVLLVMLLLVIGVIAYLLVFIPLRDGIDISTYIRSLFDVAN